MIVAAPAAAHADPNESKEAKLPNIDSFIDEIVTAQLDDHKLPGAVVTVVADGETAFAKGYGESDLDSGTKMDPEDTVLYAASEAKLFTAEAVLQLVEAGKLDLDTDVNEYLSSVTIEDTYPNDPITAEHLLTYTSGFDNDIYGWAQWEKNEAPSLKDFGKSAQPERVRKPGQLSAYNNYDYVLLGLLIEDLTGMSYSDYLEKNIFDPLGMDSTSSAPSPPQDLQQRLAKAYRPSGGSQTETMIGDRSSPSAPTGGDTVTTSADMARYMLAQLQTDNKALQEQHFAAHKAVPGMGYAFEQRHHNGHTVVIKDGDLPGTHHNLALIPEYDIGIHVAYNGDGVKGGAGWRGKELIHRVIEQYLPAPETDAPKKPEDGDVSRYAGQYRDTRASHTNFTNVQTLTGPITVEATGDGTLATVGLSENPDVATQNWIQTKPGVFARDDGRETLAFTEDGALVSSQTPQAGYERISWYQSPAMHMVVVSICAVVLIIAFFAVPIIAVVRRARKRETHPWGARIAWATAWLSTLCLVMFATGFVLIMQDSNRLMELPLTGDLTLSISLNTVSFMGVFTLATLALSAISWWKQWWSTWGRVFYAITVASSVGFMWIAIAYRLIGVPFVITV